MKRLAAFFKHPLLWATLGLLALSALVWWVGPLVAIAERRPLDGVLTRVLLLVLLWTAWVARLAWQAWRRRRLQARLLQGIAGGPSAAEREAQVLAQRFDEAVARLRAAQPQRGLLRWLGASPTLYELPWYVFVGAPGAGKTTALLNAGLQFLLTDGGSGTPVPGSGGTRHCDWWFTREAVLIDTAGRYATQDSDRDTDAAAWGRFLALLRRYRPRQPINGVLLTVSVQDLLQQGAAERQQQAAALQARLHELQRQLGVRPPVYVLVTKADLVAGFNESFEALSQEERAQVLGFSFERGDAADTAPLAGFEARFAELQQRLAEQLPDRLQAERDPARRAAIFGFLHEFASLRPLLAEFLGHVFGGSVADGAGAAALGEPVLLRGVYFSSGTQEGTPIDRVMGTMARSFGLERRAAAALPPGRGRSYFLGRLLRDLVFAERHLVSAEPQAERRRRQARAAGLAALGLASLALLAGWGVSAWRNAAYADAVLARVPALKAGLAALPPATVADPLPLVAPLAAVRDAAQPAGFALDDAPLLDRLGLYLGDQLDAGAQQGYARLLERTLMPRVVQRLQERLRAANKDNLEQAYLALKAYLMPYTPAQFDPVMLKAWIALDWDSQFKGLAPAQRAALDAHLDALLAQGAPRSAAPVDAALVASVREMLASFPLEYRVYSQLRRQAADLPEWTVAAAAGPNAPQVFERASGLPLGRGVPGFYTRDGYARAFQGSVGRVAARLADEDRWVLGRSSGGGALASQLQSAELDQRVRRLYLQDYVKAWDGLLADVRLQAMDRLERSLALTRLLAAADSPLAAWLRAVARETQLVPPAPSGAGAALSKAAQAADQAAQQAKGELARLADPGAAPAAAAGSGPVERLVDDHFAALQRLVAGSPAPLDELLKLFGEIYAQLQAIDAAQKSKSPPPPAAGGAGDKLKAAAGQAPDAVRALLETVADAGARQGRSAEREAMTGELKPIADFCGRAIANRYPFAAGAKADVLPEDFGQLFGPGGQLDDFFARRLAPLVDVGVTPWRYRPLADGSKPASAAALADFQRAARIREVFFRGGGKTPGFRLDLRAVELADGLKEIALDIDGQVSRFTPGNTAAVTLSWPSPRVASQIRLSATPGGAPLLFEGPWALFRLFERFEVQPGAQPEKFAVVLNLDGRRARLEVTASSVLNPLRLPELQQFRCPGAL